MAQTGWTLSPDWSELQLISDLPDVSSDYFLPAAATEEVDY